MSGTPWSKAARARTARLWTQTYTYLNGGSETAEWLGELFECTETSFLREALTEADAVLDKAGWISDSDPDYNAICDAGIIEADGHDYVFSLMTGMPDGESNRLLFEELAATIFDAREALNLQQ